MIKEPGLRSEPIVDIEDNNLTGECHVREIVAKKAGTSTNTAAPMSIDDARPLCVISKELRGL